MKISSLTSNVTLAECNTLKNCGMFDQFISLKKKILLDNDLFSTQFKHLTSTNKTMTIGTPST